MNRYRSWLIGAAMAAAPSTRPQRRRSRSTSASDGRDTPATISPLLFQKTDIMRHYGRSYTVEAIRLAGTTAAL